MLADVPNGVIGIECTRFAISARQDAHGLFRETKRRLMSLPPEHFANLSGYMVYLWFNDGDAPALSHRRTDDEAIGQLLQALADYQPDPTALSVVAADGLPNPAPSPPTAATNGGANFYAIPLMGAVPDSMLFNIFGFELGLAFTTHHDLREEADRFVEQIRVKDRRENDWLLISVGAPDKHGVMYLAEEVLADAVLDLVDLDLPHLHRVIAHFWDTGRTVDLWPTPEVLFGPLYQGSIPSGRPLKQHDAPGV